MQGVWHQTPRWVQGLGVEWWAGVWGKLLEEWETVALAEAVA